MPTYTYHCRSCKHTWDKISKIADRAIPTTEPCPSCATAGEIEQHLGTAPIIDPTRLSGRVKPRSDFIERIGQIRKGVPHNTIRDF